MTKLRVLTLLTLCCALLASAQAAELRTWIVGATVLSPEQHDQGRKLNVLIEGERIAAVAETLPPNAAKYARIVDATGMVLIPGLIDSHIHPASVAGMTPVMEMNFPALVAAYRAQQPRSYLRYGYTTVIALNVSDEAVLKEFTSAPAHPDLYHCGHSVPMPNGYPMQFAPPEVRFRIFSNFIFDPQHADGVPAGTDPQTHTPEAAVRRVKQEGGICVKTYFERGFGRDRNLPVPTLEQITRLETAAKTAGLPVLLHANSLEAQRFGIDAGVNVFAHGMWNWGDLNASAALPDPARAVLDEVISRRIGYMPTMQVIAGLRVLYERGTFDGPGVARVVPQPMLAWYQSPQSDWYKEELAGGATDEWMRSRLDVPLNHVAQVVDYLAQKNALFLFGTDTPSGPTAGNLPGLNGYLEMKRLVGAGLSLRQLFEAATLNNARMFGLESQMGTIAEGKRANLLLLARSPLESVEAYDSIRGIWIGGQHLDPASLEAGH